MSTAQSVKTQIQSLIDQANAKTGRTDTDLTSAVGMLVSGYGSGSSGKINHLALATNIRLGKLDDLGVSELTLDMPNITTLYLFLDGSLNTTVEKITINSNNKIQEIRHAFEVKKVTDDTALKYIVLNIDLSECTRFDYAFARRSKVISILGTPMDLSAASTTGGMFLNLNELENVYFVKDTIKIGVSFQYSPLLSAESIQSIIDGLATVETSQTLTLHADVKAKLTEAQLTTITSKNWTLA